jgi:hypothetical protein
MCVQIYLEILYKLTRNGRLLASQRMDVRNIDLVYPYAYRTINKIGKFE